MISTDLHLPSNVDDKSQSLTNDEQFGLVKNINFTSNTAVSTVAVLVKNAISHIDSLSDYEKLATVMGQPAIATYKNDRWNKDEEFGRQILNGVNPILIRRCLALPSNFPVTNDMVKSSLVRGLTLEDEMKVSHFIGGFSVSHHFIHTLIRRLAMSIFVTWGSLMA